MESAVSFSVCEALRGAVAGLAARVSLRRPLTDNARANRRAPLTSRKERGNVRATAATRRPPTRSRARPRAARLPCVAERCGKKGLWRFLIAQTTRASEREIRQKERVREREEKEETDASRRDTQRRGRATDEQSRLVRRTSDRPVTNPFYTAGWVRSCLQDESGRTKRAL